MLHPLEIGSTHYTESHEPHSEISDEIPKDDIDQSKDYEHRDDNNGKKTKTLTVMSTNKLTPKEGLLLRHRNL